MLTYIFIKCCLAYVGVYGDDPVIFEDRLHDFRLCLQSLLSIGVCSLHSHCGIHCTRTVTTISFAQSFLRLNFVRQVLGPHQSIEFVNLPKFELESSYKSIASVEQDPLQEISHS